MQPGRFYYRFPQGESGLDVYTRVRIMNLFEQPSWRCSIGFMPGWDDVRCVQVTSFISTMFRDFADIHIGRPDLNVIIVTHGLTLRL
eukprot:32457-Eustigmatos_ZCMA.PRE.1